MEPARPNTLETKCICAQVGIITVPPREGAGQLGTTTSNGTLHHTYEHTYSVTNLLPLTKINKSNIQYP